MNSWEYDHFNRAVQRIEQILLEIKKQGETTMTQLDDMNTKIKAVNDGLDNLGTLMTKASADEQKAIADLKAAIAAGGSQADLTTQLQALDSASAKIAAIASVASSLDTDVIAADPVGSTTPTA